MSGSPAFYRAASAFMILSGLGFLVIGIVTPMVSPDPVAVGIFALAATLAWTAIIFATIGIYNWFARR